MGGITPFETACEELTTTSNARRSIASTTRGIHGRSTSWRFSRRYQRWSALVRISAPSSDPRCPCRATVVKRGAEGQRAWSSAMTCSAPPNVGSQSATRASFIRACSIQYVVCGNKNLAPEYCILQSIRLGYPPCLFALHVDYPGSFVGRSAAGPSVLWNASTACLCVPAWPFAGGVGHTGRAKGRQAGGAPFFSGLPSRSHRSSSSLRGLSPSHLSV